MIPRLERFDSEFKLLTTQQKRRRRYLKWYKRWLEFVSWDKKHGKANMDTYERIHLWMDWNRGYGRAFLAHSSYLSMRLAVEDCLEANCDECKHRFKCFTE